MIALTHRALAESPWGGPDLKRLRRLWSYVRAEIIDERRGGWRWFGLDSVTARRLPKSTPWKDPSHEVAGLTQCIEMLELDA